MSKEQLQKDLRADVIWSPLGNADLVFSVWIATAPMPAFSIAITLAGHPVMEKTLIAAGREISIGNANSPVQGKLNSVVSADEGKVVLYVAGLKYPNGGVLNPTSVAFVPNWSPPDYPDLVFSVVMITSPEPAFSAIITYRGQPFLEATLNAANPSIPFSLSDETRPASPFIKGQLDYIVLNSATAELDVADLQYPGGSVASQILASMPITATPAILPASGSYTTAQTITITDQTTGAVVYYTTDGSMPTSASTQYTGSFTLSTSGVITVNAIAIAPGAATSGPATATYTLTIPDSQVVAAVEAEENPDPPAPSKQGRGRSTQP